MKRLALALVLTLAVTAVPPAAAGKAPARPNIVVILADDLSWDLVRFMPNVQRMQREGASFTNYVVTNSLCCPSRASILTGEYPHNTGVLNNTPPHGGYSAFRAGGAQRESFAVTLQQRGYRTAWLGKYMNGYRPGHQVPPGWSSWTAPGGNAYNGFDYTVNVNGRRARFGTGPRAYVTDMLGRRAREFTSRLARTRAPFAMVLAPFTPHRPYIPAPRHAALFPGLVAPRTPAFGARNAGAPAWLAARDPLRADQIAAVDRDYRLRAQSVVAIDEAVGALRRQIALRGLRRNTYIFFTSDNGYHMGDHGLMNGKMTAFDTDIRVPLIVTGPGIPAGTEINELTANIDLAPTFLELARAPVEAHVNGESLVPLLRDERAWSWRDQVLIEHFGPWFAPNDPDRQGPPSGNPPTYDAVRTSTATYVRYETGEREYYDRRRDPFELRNAWDDLAPHQQQELDRSLRRLVHCYDARTCRRASRRP